MAEETFELYSLTGKLVMETGQFDRAVSASRPKAQALHGDLRKLETQVKSTGSSLNKDLASALDAIHPRLGHLTTGGVTGLAIAGLGALTAIVTGAAVGVWTLTTRFSDMGSELADLRDQLNLTTDDLGTFAGVGKSVGVEVQELSTGLVTFQKNLAKGDEIFKLLGVTAKDNAGALRETMKAIAGITDETLQSAVAQEVWGKGGKAMLAIIKATGGDFDAAQAKLRKWNVLLSAEAIEIADEFGDKLGELSLRAQGLGNTFATETAPAFIAGFVAIEAALDSNSVQWKEWGEFVAKVILSAETVLGGLAYALTNLDWTNFVPGYGALKFWQEFVQGMNKTADIIVPEYVKRTTPASVSAPPELAGGLRPQTDLERRLSKYLQDSGGSGGRRKGKTDEQREAEKEARELERIQEQRADALARLNSEIKKYHDELKGIDTTTRSYAVAESILTGVLKDASPEVQKQHETAARAADNKEKQLKLQKELHAFMVQEADAVRLAIEGEKSHQQVTEEKIRSLERQGAVLQETTKAWMRFAAIMRDSFELIKSAPERIDKVTEQFPLPPILFPAQTEDEIARGAGDTANREAGPAPPRMKLDPLVHWKRIVEDFSYDLTFTIEDAIRAGFEGGIDDGIKAFGLGLLQMAKHEALDALRRAISNALNPGKEGGDQGGGGFFQTLLGFGTRAIAGLFGGGFGSNTGGFAGGPGAGGYTGVGMKAGGGYASPGSWYFAGDRGTELIKAGPHGDTVYPHGESMGMLAGAGAGGWNITINAKDVSQAFSRETLTQAKSKLKKLQRGR